MAQLFKALEEFVENLHNEDLVCPYCGTKQPDTHEFEEGEGETECVYCENIIKFTKEYIIRFRTTE